MRSPSLGKGHHGVDDRVVARAPAQVPRDRFAHPIAGGFRIVLEQFGGNEHDPRCAEAALK